MTSQLVLFIVFCIILFCIFALYKHAIHNENKIKLPLFCSVREGMKLASKMDYPTVNVLIDNKLDNNSKVSCGVYFGDVSIFSSEINPSIFSSEINSSVETSLKSFHNFNSIVFVKSNNYAEIHFLNFTDEIKKLSSMEKMKKLWINKLWINKLEKINAPSDGIIGIYNNGCKLL